MKEYSSAPLPFVGQKRMFTAKFRDILRLYPDNATYIDLFGGSGLLSHITKREKPEATVVYNDYNDYSHRLRNIQRTNMLLSDFRQMASGLPRHRPIPKEIRMKIYERIENEENTWGYVDYITISSSLLFSMKYKTNLEGLRKETLYNNIRRSGYRPADDYLDGLVVTHEDYKEVFNRYKGIPNAVFLVDPPYLSTDVGTYTMSWRLADYLDVLAVLQGHPFVYFTSNKSQILELCSWMEEHPDMGNPFQNAGTVTFNARMNYNASYTDMMLYSPAI